MCHMIKIKLILIKTLIENTSGTIISNETFKNVNIYLTNFLRRD